MWKITSLISVASRACSCVCTCVTAEKCSKIAHSCNVSIYAKSMQKAILFIWLNKIISHPWIDYYSSMWKSCVRVSGGENKRSYHRHEHFHYETITRTGKCDASKGKLIKDKHTRARSYTSMHSHYVPRDGMRLCECRYGYECYLSSRSWNNNGSATQMGCEDWRWFYTWKCLSRM